MLALVGSAGGLDDAAVEALGEVMGTAVLPTEVRLGTKLLDGGTDSSVMRLVGQAQVAANGELPLVGVAAEGTVVLPGTNPPQDDAADLEVHHAHPPAGRPLIVAAGSGRAADVIADAHATGEGDARAVPVVASRLSRIAHLQERESLALAIAAGLGEPGAHP